MRGDIPEELVSAPKEPPDLVWSGVATALQHEDYFTKVGDRRLEHEDGFFGTVYVEYLPDRGIINVWCLGNRARDYVPFYTADITYHRSTLQVVRHFIDRALAPAPDWGELDGWAIPSGVLLDIRAESVRAHLKHGDHSLLGKECTDVERLAALVEEVGEVANRMTYDRASEVELEKELVQVANVAGSWVTFLRGGRNGRAQLPTRPARIDSSVEVKPKTTPRRQIRKH